MEQEQTGTDLARRFAQARGYNEAQIEVLLEEGRQSADEFKALFDKMSSTTGKAALATFAQEAQMAFAVLVGSGEVTTIQLVEVLELLVKQAKRADEVLLLIKQLANAPKAVAA